MVEKVKYKFLLITIFLTGLVGCQNAGTIGNRHSLQPKNVVFTHLEKKTVHPVSKEKLIQTKVTEYLLSHHINGSVAVLNDNRIIFNEGVGYSSFKNRKRNQSSTTYPIGSITKAFVATSIMQLQEKGKLNIEDPVSKYIPHFPNGKRIKLIHLLSHTSGIQNPIWHTRDLRPQDLIREIKKRHVTFRPGTKWEYRDANYMVLGYIVEKVAGMSLHDYIQFNIFDKANMGESGFITRSYTVPYNSVGYMKQGQQLLRVGNFTIPLLFGCGDIYSTAYDLSLFDQSLLNGNLVSNKSLKEMVTPRSKSKYGLGFYNNGNVFLSRGVLGGFESIHALYKDKTSIAILLNVRDKTINIHKTLREIHKLINLKIPV
jgi:teichoic acid D-alanine hydrolase